MTEELLHRSDVVAPLEEVRGEGVAESLARHRYLERPRCESCGIGIVRPVDVMGGERVVFRCSNRVCFVTVHAELPPLKKKVIYLDTSIISSMAKAKAREDTDSPYLKLYEALRRATARNLIVCPGSTIVESEAEFSSLSDTIVEMSRHLSDPGLHHELHVKEMQLLRALERFLAGQPPELEVRPQWRDAFQSDPDVWHGTFNVMVNMHTPEEFIAAARTAKTATLPQIEEMYRAYERDGFTFQHIVDVEERGFAEAVRINGRNMYAARLAYTKGETDNVHVWWSSTFDKIVAAIQYRTNCSMEEALRTGIDFLVSPYSSKIPYAYISGRLQAQLAMLCRGEKARLPDGGDDYDIEHMATFVPYVDLFVADKFFAGLANQSNLRIGDPFGTEIRSLRPSEIRDFIDWLERLAVGHGIAMLSERISESIWQGGFHQDFASHVRESDA